MFIFGSCPSKCNYDAVGRENCETNRRVRNLKLYMRYVDDTLLLAKEDDMIYIFGKFNAGIFRGNSSNSSSVQSNWNCKTSKIKSLYHCTKKICSSKKKFKYRIDKIKIFMPRNGYLSYTPNSIITLLKSNTNSNRNEETNDEKKII